MKKENQIHAHAQCEYLQGLRNVKNTIKKIKTLFLIKKEKC